MRGDAHRRRALSRSWRADVRFAVRAEGSREKVNNQRGGPLIVRFDFVALVYMPARCCVVSFCVFNERAQITSRDDAARSSKAAPPPPTPPT